MEDCKTLKPGMLPNPVEIVSEQGSMNLSEAKIIADEVVGRKVKGPMLLAWFDGVTGRFSPNVTCCGDDKPTWLVYAESGGADLSVSVNDGQCVFVYRSEPFSHELP